MSNFVTFEDIAKIKKEFLRETAPASIMTEHQQNVKFRRMLSSDMAIGRLLTGPQFIDDVTIDEGAVKASKLEAELVLSTAIIAGMASPGDRIELDSSGQNAYGTVSGTPNTHYYGLDSSGWFVGTGSDRMEFDATSGTLTVPAAVITSLTIADVGSGVVGGDYDTGGSNPKLRLGTSGVQMWNAAGTRTVFLNATNGEFTLSNDPAGADRILVSSSGIELWKSSTRQFYLQAGGATNAVTMLLTGPGASDYIGLNPTDGIWTGASTFAGASNKFRVTPAGSLSATGATISGAITATSGELQTLSVNGTLTLGVSGLLRTSSSSTRLEMDSTGLYGYNGGTARFRVLNDGSGFLGASSTFSWTNAGSVILAGFTANSTTLSAGGGNVFMSSGATAFQAGGGNFSVTSGGQVSASALVITGPATFSGGTLTLPNGGSIGQSTVDINGSGSGTPGTFSNMNLDGTTTIVSGGKIIDADGSYWDQTGLILVSSGAYGDAIRWKQSGTDRGSIYSTTNGMIVAGGSGTSSDGFLTLTTSQATLQAGGSSGVILTMTTSGGLTYLYNGGIDLTVDTSGHLSSAGRMYPGAGSIQNSRYLSDNGTALTLTTPYPRISGSSGANNPILYFDAAYSVGSTTAWSTNGPGTANIASVSTTYLLINIAGTLYRIPIWANS